MAIKNLQGKMLSFFKISSMVMGLMTFSFLLAFYISGRHLSEKVVVTSVVPDSKKGEPEKPKSP